MPILVNKQYPFLNVYIPDRGEYRHFLHGQLEFDDDDPDAETLLRVAAEDPTISVIVDGIETCPDCDETFHGKMAKARLAKHRNQEHPDSTAKDKDPKRTKIKTAPEFVCTVCGEALEDDEALVLHTATLHTSKESVPEA